MSRHKTLLNWGNVTTGGRPFCAAALGILALALAACRAPQPAGPTPALASATVSIPTPAPAATVPATAPAPAGAYYPPETRTGIEATDRVIEAFLAGDQEQLRSLVHYTVTGCTHAEGLGGPPKCEAGQAEGTEVEVFPILGPEGTFASRETIDGVFPQGDYALHAVYRVAADAEAYDYWPAGEYGIVFVERQTGMGLTMLVDEAGIVRTVYTFPGQPLFIHDVAEYILEPAGPAGSAP